MTLTGAAVVFLTSLTALPVSYTLNTVSSTKNQWLIFVVGCISLIFVTLLPWIILRRKVQSVDSFFYGLSLLAFSSVMSLIIALENDGLIAEFMGLYLREGEPYLKTAHGTMMSYLDGIAHYALYLMMLAALSWNQAFFDVGLVWVGSFGYSNVILAVSVIVGKDGVSWPFLIRFPFILICLWSTVRFMGEKHQCLQKMQINMKESKTLENRSDGIWRRPVDLCFILYFLCATCFTVFRFMAAMGGNMSSMNFYVEKIEPYLTDELPYAKVQQMVQLFYFVPFYMLSVYALLRPGQSWIFIWSLIYAGATAQAQLSFMGASIHYRTPYIHRVPQTGLARSVFWAVNGLMLIIPQFLAFRIQSNPNFFLWHVDREKLGSLSDATASNGNMINHSSEGKME